MTSSDTDWAVLRGAVLALAGAVATSAGGLVAGYLYWSDRHAQYERVRDKLHGIRGRYETAHEEGRIIETYLPRFEALRSRGIIGRAQRLDWIEALRSASRQLELPTVHYAISTEEKYAPEFRSQIGTFEVHASVMKLKLGLLHEEDLLRLLAALDERASGLYSVDSCTLRRMSESFLAEPMVSNVSADCTLRWTTVRQSDGGDRSS